MHRVLKSNARPICFYSLIMSDYVSETLFDFDIASFYAQQSPAMCFVRFLVSSEPAFSVYAHTTMLDDS